MADAPTRIPPTPPPPPPPPPLPSLPGPGGGAWRRDRVVLVGILVMVILTGGGLAAIALTSGGDTPAAGAAPGHTPSGAGAPTAPASEPPSRTATPGGVAGLVAADDFTGSTLDPMWSQYNSTSPIGGIWSSSQLRVADGSLRVVGEGRNPTGSGNRSGGLCLCGPGGDQLYGRWEVRARFDPGAGYGQTIGLWPASNQDRDGTITFVNTREADRRTLRMYVVWFDSAGTRRSYESTVRGDYTGWHTYGVEWRAGSVRISLDGRVVYDTAKSPTRVTIPAKPLHLFLQQTVGPRDGVSAATASTPAEVALTVDWVRQFR